MEKFLNIMKYVLVVIVFVALLVLFILLSKKSSKIAALELTVRELKASLELERLNLKYARSTEELVQLRKSDAELDKALAEIELSIEIPLEGVVSAEDIAAALVRLGL